MLLPSTTIFHLQRIKSDHCPIVIQFGDGNCKKVLRPSRFLSNWLLHDKFDGFVSENWVRDNINESTMEGFVNVTKKWNKEVFGNVVNKKHILLVRIEGVQRKLEVIRSRRLITLEKELQGEINRVLDVEESLWRQKSRSDWLALEDVILDTSTIVLIQEDVLIRFLY